MLLCGAAVSPGKLGQIQSNNHVSFIWLKILCHLALGLRSPPLQLVWESCLKSLCSPSDCLWGPGRGGLLCPEALPDGGRYTHYSPHCPRTFDPTRELKTALPRAARWDLKSGSQWSVEPHVGRGCCEPEGPEGFLEEAAYTCAWGITGADICRALARCQPHARFLCLLYRVILSINLGDTDYHCLPFYRWGN